MTLIAHVRAEQERQSQHEPLRFIRPGPAPSWREILSQVAQKHAVPADWILSPRRSAKIATARQEVMYRLYRETKFSLPAIGQRLDRDHTTVLWGIKQHEKRMAPVIQAAE